MQGVLTDASLWKVGNIAFNQLGLSGTFCVCVREHSLSSSSQWG